MGWLIVKATSLQTVTGSYEERVQLTLSISYAQYILRLFCSFSRECLNFYLQARTSICCKVWLLVPINHICDFFSFKQQIYCTVPVEQLKKDKINLWIRGTRCSLYKQTASLSSGFCTSICAKPISHRRQTKCGFFAVCGPSYEWNMIEMKFERHQNLYSRRWKVGGAELDCSTYINRYR